MRAAQASLCSQMQVPVLPDARVLRTARMLVSRTVSKAWHAVSPRRARAVAQPLVMHHPFNTIRPAELYCHITVKGYVGMRLHENLVVFNKNPVQIQHVSKLLPCTC
jgi:hypothetical protein